MKALTDLAGMWARHAAEWRDPAQVCSQWREATDLDAALLESRASKRWWSILEELGITLLVTREYEHLVMGVSALGGRPRLTYFPVPHPSGLTADRAAGRVHLASTRNPNQVYEFRPATSALDRRDVKPRSSSGRPLVPVSTMYYPGCLYMHDLAVIGGALYANSVGQNAIVRLVAAGRAERVWWPRCIERRGVPDFTRNYIQLNSIAAGRRLSECYFSASSAAIGRRRPGHLDYPVDGRGVIFSARTREPVCEGLTRPHSARLRNRQIWVANSGYGELGFVSSGRLEVVRKMCGWTRGLCIVADTAFVATSRVIPRFARYAPGLRADHTRCGVHAVCCRSGELLGSLEWPNGNQIFAIDWISDRQSTGFAFNARSRRQHGQKAFFYTYQTDQGEK